MATTRTIIVAIAIAMAGSVGIISPATAAVAARESVAATQVGILAAEGTLTAGGSINSTQSPAANCV